MAANIILIIHFIIAIFIGASLILIPLGGFLEWSWVRIRLFRQIHAGLIVFVMVESLLGVTCPLTTLESYLRQSQPPESFIGHWLNKVLYWDLPNIFFLVLYTSCVAWTFALWLAVPPRKTNSHQRHH